MTVNKERVRLLVEALRSGQFEQTTGRLRLGNKYCCLGVACEIARRAVQGGYEDGPQLVAALATLNDDGDPIYAYGDVARWQEDKIDTVLPRSVREWYGFDEKSHGDPELVVGENDALEGVSVIPGDRLSATSWNDDAHASFATIADAFERTFLTETETETETENEK